MDARAPAFVGRADELAVLAGAYASARDVGPAWVLIGGEPGIGKSRLVREFLSQPAFQEARVLSGGVPITGQDLPFAPFIAACRSTLRPPLDSALAARIAGVLPALGTLFPALPRVTVGSAEEPPTKMVQDPALARARARERCNVRHSGRA